MKLRAVELTNVRRFAGRTVRIGGIGDGVSVLAAPNESGKSTLFDALQALLFERHTGRSKEIQSLRPHAGGGPAAAAEIEIDGRPHRIEKRWLSRPEARVLGPGGALVAQADQAEAWIAAHLAAPLGGPSGLLWVRQGQAEFPRGHDPAARRDILGQVAGEIDAMTGGRRMDAVLARVAAALEPLATATGRPRAGGPWARAEAEVEALAQREAELADQVQRLAAALAERRQAQRRAADLADPAEAEARARRRAEARAAEDALRRHADRRAQAEAALRLAEATRAEAAGRRERLRERADAVAAAALAAGPLAAARDAAQRRSLAAAEAAGRARTAAEAARATAAAAAEAHAAALAHQQARAAAARVQDLADRLARAEAALRRAAEAEAARAALPVTPERLEAARRAEGALAALLAQVEARAVTLAFSYDGPARALREGRPVEGVQRLSGPARFDLPGLGHLTVTPGAAGEEHPAARLPEARALRDRALAACGAATLAEAAAALTRAEDLTQQARAARGIAEAIAPEGIAALRRSLAEAEARAAADAPGEAGDPAALLTARTEAERRAAAADAEARTAEAAAAKASSELAVAEVTLANARLRLDGARAALGPEDEHALALARAEADHTAASLARDRAAADLALLDREAPDPATVAALLARAEGEAAQHEAARRATERRLDELRGQIGTLAGLGIEEDLAEVRGRLETARARARAQADEVAALLRLRAALDAARGAARAAYLAPVIEEFTPLLRLLHPGAALAIDDATLLPAALERDGRAEEIGILSGGTREQIAVLTRLAFARLFARRGQAVPVILDDALVQTDDARIEAMFTALHRAAQGAPGGQQVIVLTCRERAFAALGGQRLAFEAVAVSP